MNVTHLKTFHRVAETRNFTQAARDLFLTQPAVSMQVQSLEHSLGVALFDRSRRRTALTSEGRILHAYTQKIFHLFDEMQEAFQNLSKGLSGCLRIGATSIMGAYFLPAFMADFHRAYPGVELDLYVGNSHEVAEQVFQGKVDLGFGGSSTAHPALSRYFLHREPLVLVCGKNSRFYGQEALSTNGTLSANGVPSANGTLSAGDLVNETFIMREAGTRATCKLKDWFREQTSQDIGPDMVTVNSMEVTKQLVATGLGLTVLPRHAASLELESGYLAAVPVRDFHLHVDYFLLHEENRPLSRLAQMFLTLLFEQGLPLPDAFIRQHEGGSEA